MKKTFLTTTLLTLLSLACASVSHSAIATAQLKNSSPVNTPSNYRNKIKQSTARFSPKQIQILKSVGMKIVVPTYIPSGFKIETLSNNSDKNYKGYTVIYRRNDNACFSIEAINGGIGDEPDLEHTLPYNSPLFGKGILNYGKYTDIYLRKQSPLSEMTTRWMEPKNYQAFYRFNGANWYSSDKGKPKCNKDISPTEAVKVINSLQYLKF
ncbi:hypothetical protein Cri9333_1196 [Crinalium epipsammum PCC 9333]|uniref:Lipoprotein n=1 Tax=Crinalium epipsammum PCC 9333 TaxID=1173022 RepID=K9VY81_9CYAN|nr:hypothetical protein [Crinalium epipsammum]AFZ12100.1 hypothetical protein Cri9333_1196 [Crinalium epipsammum PCC 9333]